MLLIVCKTSLCNTDGDVSDRYQNFGSEYNYSNTILSGELNNYSIFLTNFQVKKLVIISYGHVYEA